MGILSAFYRRASLYRRNPTTDLLLTRTYLKYPVPNARRWRSRIRRNVRRSFRTIHTRPERTIYLEVYYKSNAYQRSHA